MRAGVDAVMALDRHVSTRRLPHASAVTDQPATHDDRDGYDQHGEEHDLVPFMARTSRETGDPATLSRGREEPVRRSLSDGRRHRAAELLGELSRGRKDHGRRLAAPLIADGGAPPVAGFAAGACAPSGDGGRAG